RFVDHLDGDGIDPDPIPIVATVTIAGDEMTIDLTGSAPQVRGAINCVFPFTLSTALACVRSIVDLSIPNNAGYFRPIHVIAPEGTVVNPRPPAAVAARGITGIRIADAIFGALAQAVPEVLPACRSARIAAIIRRMDCKADYRAARPMSASDGPMGMKSLGPPSF